MVKFSPAPSPGTLVGYAILALLLLLDAGLLFLIFGEPITFSTFVWGALLFFSLPVFATVALAIASLTAATYVVAGNELIIAWGWIRHTLARQQIATVRVLDGPVTISRFRGVRWPGLLTGHGRLASGETDEAHTSFYCSNTTDRLLLVQSAGGSIVLSPADPEALATALTANATRPGDPAETLTAETYTPAFFVSPIWSDRSAQVLIGLGLALTLLFFAVLAARYPSLPPMVPLHFDNDKLVAVSGPTSRLFLLPSISLTTWILNGLVGAFFYEKRQDYLGAYLLWGATVVVAATAIVAGATLLA